MAAKYCQVNIKTTWLSSLVTSWFHLFWGGGSFPTAQIQQSYQAICPQVYAISIFSLLMPLFSIHHTLWNEILQVFKAHSEVQDAFSLPPGLVSLFPLLPEGSHFLPCTFRFSPLTYISVCVRVVWSCSCSFPIWAGSRLHIPCSREVRSRIRNRMISGSFFLKARGPRGG